MDSTLLVTQLGKTYGSTVAVKDVSFSVKPGEIVGLLGENGAGKTTTLNMILGIVTPTTGSIHIFGKNLTSHRGDLLGQINFVAPYAHLPGNLTAWQNLTIFSYLYDIPHPPQRVRTLLEDFGLMRLANTKVGLLSSGEQSRLSLAKAFLNEPKLLLLDEPTASLDPHTSDTIRKKLKKYAVTGGAAILWTSHDMYEVEAVCDRVLFIAGGSIILEGNPRELASMHGTKNLDQLFVALINRRAHSNHES
ncbi:MAG: ABC transporter ATP-binding protein [Patescibacteria group bacterium]